MFDPVGLISRDSLLSNDVKSSSSIDDLPDEILAIILEQGAGVNTSRVSKKWSNLMNPENAIGSSAKTNSEKIWKAISEKFGYPNELEPKANLIHQWCIDLIAQIKDVLSEISFKDKCFLEDLLYIEKITYVQINELKKWKVARDTIIVWIAIAEQILTPLENFKLFSDMHKVDIVQFADRFNGWCEKTDLSKLKELTIKSKKLTFLPSLDKCTSLEVLIIMENGLLTIPSLDKLTLLKGINFTNNKLTSLPAINLPALEGLFLFANNLRTLPSLDNLPSLKNLLLDYNRELSSLPPLNLPKLTELGISETKLVSAPSFDKLTSLEVLSIDKNLLTEATKDKLKKQGCIIY